LMSVQEWSLKQRRVAKLLTQQELALLSGQSQAVIDSIERGFIKPNKETTEAIKKALDNRKGSLE